jgi:hypothetical protein
MREFRNLLSVCDGNEAPLTTWNGKYCYLCSTVRDRNNDYRQKILELLEFRDEMDPFQMCHTVAQYYQRAIQPFTKQPWPVAAVERHLSECTNDIPYTTSLNLRALAAYNRGFMKTAVRKGEDGKEQAPNPTHVLCHMKIMAEQRKQIELYYRLKTRSLTTSTK